LLDPAQTATDRPAKIPNTVVQSVKHHFHSLPWNGKDLDELLEFTLGEISVNRTICRIYSS
jgi:50S ribosomal protein L16 3-hydroxylase